MNVNKKMFFVGILSGLVSPSMVSADIAQSSRYLTMSSYKPISSRVQSEESQMRADFFRAGDDIRAVMSKNG